MKYTSIDELIGKIEGVERTILIDEDDTLLNTIEKIALIPDSKLVMVTPIQVPYRNENGAPLSADVKTKVTWVTRPKVQGVISMPDIFSKLQHSNKHVFN